MLGGSEKELPAVQHFPTNYKNTKSNMKNHLVHSLNLVLTGLVFSGLQWSGSGSHPVLCTPLHRLLSRLQKLFQISSGLGFRSCSPHGLTCPPVPTPCNRWATA